VREAAGGDALSPAVEAWLSDAEALAEIFFDPGSDQLKAVRVRMTIGETTFEPENFAKKASLDRIHVYFGDGSDFEWKDDEVDTKNLRMKLFGDEAMEYSWVRGMVAQKKGLVGRVIGGDWKEGESVEAAAAEGFWAPLRVIRDGMQPGAAASETLDLRYTLTIQLKKGNTAQAMVAVQASGSALPRLLRLMQQGLPAPPSGLS
jgi:hypothetical protein